MNIHKDNHLFQQNHNKENLIHLNCLLYDSKLELNLYKDNSLLLGLLLIHIEYPVLKEINLHPKKSSHMKMNQLKYQHHHLRDNHLHSYLHNLNNFLVGEEFIEIIDIIRHCDFDIGVEGTCRTVIGRQFL